MKSSPRIAGRPLGLLFSRLAAFALVATASAQEQYQKAPSPIPTILDASVAPVVSLSPRRDWLLLVQGERYPSIAELSEPMLALAGLRINPANHGPSRTPRFVGLTLKRLEDGTEIPIPLPQASRIGSPVWSSDGTRFAFARYGPDEVELWVGTVADGTVRQIPDLRLNAVMGAPFEWLPDSRTLLARSRVAGQGQPPAEPRVPAGPNIQESFGKSATIRTYQDLLKNPHDEALFEYYATAQLVRVDARTAQVSPFGAPGLFAGQAVSPDGRHCLVTRIVRPYSYQLTVGGFPREIEIWNQVGERVRHLASRPLAEEVPIGGVVTGPRDFEWRPTDPATLVWVEALDGGDPKRKVPHRDRIWLARAPFDQPVELARVEHRHSGLEFGDKDGLALRRDYDRDRRWGRAFLLNVDDPALPERLLWDRSVQDRYHDPGAPVLRRLTNGFSALWQHENAIFLRGAGASARGDYPFLDRLDLATLRTERLFQCDDQSYEYVVALAAEDGSRFLTHHETPASPPNYFLRQAGRPERKPLTDFRDPAPQLRAIRKQLIPYERADGVPLSFTLCLPPGYQPGTRLPTVVWAYPREYNDPATAGQVSGSTNRFTTLTGASHLFFLTQGYAVLDNATMPVVGHPETMNDTFVEQIVASAQAAVAKAVELGVTDPDRVGVGGHSYGAFMTANLLAHCDLFRAGIARSGAYNRTLTPFGFQGERRTLWEAPETYLKLSPFLQAHRINEPILLIHGEVDDNAGTFPIQSERLFQAIKGNRGQVRYVTLPHESHGYAARESIEHALFEMVAWFDRHVKNAPPRSQPGVGNRDP